jgi:hypothetical protein
MELAFFVDGDNDFLIGGISCFEPEIGAAPDAAFFIKFMKIVRNDCFNIDIKVGIVEQHSDRNVSHGAFERFQIEQIGNGICFFPNACFVLAVFCNWRFRGIINRVGLTAHFLFFLCFDLHIVRFNRFCLCRTSRDEPAKQSDRCDHRNVFDQRKSFFHFCFLL